MRLRSTLLALGTLCLCAVPALADTVNFSDSTFNLANYSESAKFLQNLGATLTFDQCASCGNPGSGLQIITSIPVAGGDTAIGFANNLFTYNPGVQGPITSIDASVDKNLTFTPPDPGGGNTFRPMIEQDGNFYLAAIPGPPGGVNPATGFNTIAQTGLTATNFVEYDFTTGTFGTANPNFDGDTMTFGLGQIFGINPNTGPQGFEADYDNLQIGINAVPEPSSILLLAAGLVFLIGLGSKSWCRSLLPN